MEELKKTTKLQTASLSAEIQTQNSRLWSSKHYTQFSLLNIYIIITALTRIINSYWKSIPYSSV